MDGKGPALRTGVGGRIRVWRERRSVSWLGFELGFELGFGLGFGLEIALQFGW